jgi:hypothetical protein
MMFMKRLREPVMRGEIAVSVRVWRRPQVKAGGRYPLGDGAVVVTAIRQISLSDVTPALARRSGFSSVEELLGVARHGKGENVYLIEFVYEPDLSVLPLVQERRPPSARKARPEKRRRKT